jgi:hypothetical protein
MCQVRALLKDSQYDAAIAEARAARDAHKDDRSVREVRVGAISHLADSNLTHLPDDCSPL